MSEDKSITSTKTFISVGKFRSKSAFCLSFHEKSKIFRADHPSETCMTHDNSFNAPGDSHLNRLQNKLSLLLIGKDNDEENVNFGQEQFLYEIDVLQNKEKMESLLKNLSCSSSLNLQEKVKAMLQIKEGSLKLQNIMSQLSKDSIQFLYLTVSFSM